MVPPPRGLLELRGPIVVVFGVPSHVHHGVDGGRTTHDFATGQFNVAMAGVRFGFGVVVPIDGGVFENGVDPGRNVDHRVPIPWPGFDQEDGVLLGQFIGQDATGGPGTDDDVVVLLLGGAGAWFWWKDSFEEVGEAHVFVFREDHDQTIVARRMFLFLESRSNNCRFR